jgi:hypothetical protein
VERERERERGEERFLRIAALEGVGIKRVAGPRLLRPMRPTLCHGICGMALADSISAGRMQACCRVSRDGREVS